MNLAHTVGQRAKETRHCDDGLGPRSREAIPYDFGPPRTVRPRAKENILQVFEPQVKGKTYHAHLSPCAREDAPHASLPTSWGGNMPHVSMGHALGIAYLIDHPAGDEEVWGGLGTFLDLHGVDVGQCRSTCPSYLVLSHISFFPSSYLSGEHKSDWAHDWLDTRSIGHTIDRTHD